MEGVGARVEGEGVQVETRDTDTGCLRIHAGCELPRLPPLVSSKIRDMISGA